MISGRIEVRNSTILTTNDKQFYSGSKDSFKAEWKEDFDINYLNVMDTMNFMQRPFKTISTRKNKNEQEEKIKTTYVIQIL